MKKQRLTYKKRLSILFLIIGLFILAGCGGEADTAEDEAAENQNDQGQGITFEEIGQGDSFIAEVEAPAAFLATNAEELETFSPWLVDNAEALEYLVGTNFEEEVVLAVFRGQMPSSGYQITVKEITAENNTLNIIVELTDPAADQVLATVISYPYHVVSISKSLFDTAETNRWTITDLEGNLLAEGNF